MEVYCISYKNSTTDLHQEILYGHLSEPLSYIPPKVEI